MIEAILRYVARALAGILERFADPDLQKRLDAYNAKVAEVEAREREAEAQARASEAAYHESVRQRKLWDDLIVESRRQEKESEERLRASQDRVKAINEETKKLKETIDSRPDSAVIRGPL